MFHALDNFTDIFKILDLDELKVFRNKKCSVCLEGNNISKINFKLGKHWDCDNFEQCKLKIKSNKVWHLVHT